MNKKLAILTLYYKNYNYGGPLQAYALSKALSNLGYNVDQISFIRDRKKLVFRKIRGYFEEPVTKDIFSVFYRKVKNKVLRKQDSSLPYTIKKFNQFMDMIPHSEVVNSKTIKDIEHNYSLFIVGSDQVWNPLFSTKEFFFNFLSENIPRISYAASIRINKYEKKEGKDINRFLDKFGYISVREKKAKLTLREIGINKKIDILPDPTFLLTKEEWTNISKPIDIDGKYIMVYLVRDSLALSNIREYAIKENLKVVLVSEPGFEEVGDDVFVSVKDGVGPAEFVWLICNAYLVIANSFHGTAFSIIFNKPFYVYGNVNVDDRKGTMLNKFKLNNRAITIDKIFDNEEVLSVDFEYANKIVEKERTDTLKKVDQIIKNLI